MKILSVGVVLVILLLFFGWLFRVDLSQLVFEQGLSQFLGEPATDLADGLHVYFCGAGSPLPDPKRSGPCVALLAGDKGFIFDAGANSTRILSRMNFPYNKIEQIFITHFHSDHIDGLGELMLQTWIAGRRQEPIQISGPTGIESVVNGFLDAYQLDRAYRIAHHGPEVANPDGFGAIPRAFAMEQYSEVVYEVGELTITAFDVDHRPVMPAVGYRIDYKGRSVVISGDTAHDPRVISVAKGADILIHDALKPEMVHAMGEVFEHRGAAPTI